MAAFRHFLYLQCLWPTSLGSCYFSKSSSNSNYKTLVNLCVKHLAREGGKLLLAAGKTLKRVSIIERENWPQTCPGDLYITSHFGLVSPLHMISWFVIGKVQVFKISKKTWMKNQGNEYLIYKQIMSQKCNARNCNNLGVFWGQKRLRSRMVWTYWLTHWYVGQSGLKWQYRRRSSIWLLMNSRWAQCRGCHTQSSPSSPSSLPSKCSWSFDKTSIILWTNLCISLSDLRIEEEHDLCKCWSPREL